jgi:hypothetical protein
MDITPTPRPENPRRASRRELRVSFGRPQADAGLWRTVALSLRATEMADDNYAPSRAAASRAAASFLPSILSAAMAGKCLSRGRALPASQL